MIQGLTPGPILAQVAGGPPAVAADLGPPFPDLTHPVLAQAVHDIAVYIVKRIAHHGHVYVAQVVHFFHRHAFVDEKLLDLGDFLGADFI